MPVSKHQIVKALNECDMTKFYSSDIHKNRPITLERFFKPEFIEHIAERIVAVANEVSE